MIMRWLKRDNEEQRLRQLREYNILDTPPEPNFDEIVRLAAKICNTPAAFITFVDRNRLWIKAKIDNESSEIPRDMSFCNQTILQSDVLIIPDTLADERFSNNPFVTSEPYLRFYAGVPLINKNKYALGTLCVTDYIPHYLTSQQIEALKQLANQIIQLLEWKRNLAKISHLKNGAIQTLPQHLFQQMAIGFGLTIAIIFSFGVGTFLSNLQVSKNDQRVSHTLNVLTNIEKIQASVQAIESGSRGYVVTGKETYLNPYYVGISDLETHLTQLKQLTQDNSEQQKSLTILEPLLQQKKDFHHYIINIRKTQGATAAWKIVNNDQGYNLGQEINRQLQEMRNKENLLLQKRSNKSKQSFQVATQVLLLGTASTLVILTLLYYIIYQEIVKRHQFEVALQKQAEFTNAILDIAPALILVINRDGRIIKINKASQQISDYTLEEVKHKYLWDVFLPEEEIEASKARIRNITTNNYPFSYQTYWLTKKGEKRLLEFANTTLLDSNGQVEYIIKIGIDITERHLAEIELEKHREWLQVTLSSIGDGVIATDNQGLITFINPVTEALTGLTVENSIGKHLEQIFKLIHAQTQQSLETPLRQTLEQGLIIYLDENTNLIRADGQQIAIDDSCAPIISHEGKIQGAVMVFRDITERKRLEEERNKFFALSLNLFAILDSRGNFTRINPAWYQILGFTQEDLIGKNYFKYVDPQEQKWRLYTLRKLLRFNELIGIENQYQDKWGKSHWFLWNAVKTENQLIFICGHEIEEQKEREKQQRLALEKEKELNQLKSRFVSIVSHEFRTPLTTLMLSSDILQSSWETLKLQRREKYFYQIKNSIQRMMNLINDILTVNQTEAGKLNYQPSELDLIEIMKDLVEDFQQGIGQKHIINFQSDRETIQGQIDKKLLENIFINLLSNAVKYSPENSQIWLTINCQDNCAVFQVKDQGIGIPEDDIKDLFNSFHRGSNVDHISGTGLGLSIVKTAVDLHGGEILVESQLGVGTTFTVSLPLNNTCQSSLTTQV